MSVLTHQNLNVRDDRETVFFINKRICGSLENDVRNQSGLFVGTWMLPNWHSHSEVIIRKIRTNCFISKNDANADNSVLWVLGTLKK